MNTQPHTSNNHKEEIATLGGGCFWCLEPVFTELQGVVKVESGYSGGNIPNPSYNLVCTGKTDHAEVVQITFDPAVITFRELLEVFFTIHDPTAYNRQGGDVGTQYRSVIFYHTSEQKHIAGQVIKDIEIEGVWPDPIVTAITPFDEFYKAEDYHQAYYQKNPDYPYCRIVITPKVNKFRQKFLEKLIYQKTG